jgi:hypothetical protein
LVDWKGTPPFARLHTFRGYLWTLFFKDLIAQLAARAPVEDVTDADIDREVQAVRNAARLA